jgi:ectoine hydroxylase-related dioxygenase (phytanoyl-CoA dioxygenase family)
MRAGLSDEQCQRYEHDGYLSPLPVFDADEVRDLRARFEAFEELHESTLRTDLHLLEKWAWHAVTDARVVDPVVSLLGPDVLLWSLNWFIKEPGDGKIVSMHQDANYWGLQPHDVVTAWIALSPASVATGPMMFVPGSHKGELKVHENTFAANNLLTRGQTINEPDLQARSELAPLAAGEMSLHHVRLVHGSGANTTSDRRIGMVLRFCATHVRQTKAADTAVLVAGQDQFGHFELLPAPLQNFGEAEQARHLDAVTKMGNILMSD